MTYDFFVQSLAIVAFAIFALSFHAKTRKNIVIVNTASLFFWAIHFFLLHAWTGALLSGTNALVSIFFVFKEQIRWVNNKWFLALIFLIFTIITILTGDDIYSVFALFGILSIITAKWQIDPKKVRLIALFADAFWIIYDYSIGSYGGIIAELLIAVSILYSLYRNRQKKTAPLRVPPSRL